jgi:GNAT superfamily N-acetyltransferase
MDILREWYYERYLVSTDKSRLDIEAIKGMLSRSYWAGERKPEVIQRSIENSVCYGVYHENQQVGFARIVTDFSTMYWLCDVYIDEKHRKIGLGKLLMKCIVETPELKDLRGLLATKDAHGLYKKYGFHTVNGKFMVRIPAGVAG